MCALEKASKIIGSYSDLARLVGVRPAVLLNWRYRKHVPLRYCSLIEQFTNGVVMRWDLRPNDWWLIWPELIHHDKAPAVLEPLRHGHP